MAYIIRNNSIIRSIKKRISYLSNFILNFGGISVDPQISGTYSIWNNNVYSSSITYPISGTIYLIESGSSFSYFGTGSSKSGETGSSGISFYPTGAIDSWWYTNNRTGSIIIDGLNPVKSYKIRVTGCIPNTSQIIETKYQINSDIIPKIVNRTGSISPILHESECAIFPNVSSSNGKIQLNIFPSTGSIGYLNVLEVRENPNGIVGNIFNETSFASISDFPITGSGITRGTNKLDLTGNPTLFTSYVYYNNTSSAHRYTGLEYWKQRVRVKSSTTINSTSYGLGIGVKSVSSWQQYSSYIRWSWDTTGAGRLYFYSVDSTSGQILSTGSYVATANTYYWVEVERIRNSMQFTLFSDSGSQLYTEIINCSLIDGFDQMHNVGQFAIHQFGGSNNEVTNWIVSSNEAKGLDYYVLGDSNTYGLFCSSSRYRWTDVAMDIRKKTFSVSAATSETAESTILKLNEIIALQPKNVILSIGRNDSSSGAPLNNITSSIRTIVNTLESSSITVKLAGVIASNVNLTNLQTFYTSMPNQQVNFFSGSKSAGTGIRTAYNSGDSIHVNVSGNIDLGNLISNIL